MLVSLVKFCSECGADIKYIIPEGDNRKRACCSSCGEIYYSNPRVICGTLVYDDTGRVLLCKRSIQPRRGMWTLPAGFMENGETMAQGAARETMEEAGCKADIMRLYTLFSLPHINQVYAFYLARALTDHLKSTTESSAIDWFELDEIDWDNLAFPTVKKTLEYWRDLMQANDMKLPENVSEQPMLQEDLYWDQRRHAIDSLPSIRTGLLEG